MRVGRVKMTEEQLAEREARVRAHAERVERELAAMGKTAELIEAEEAAAEAAEQIEAVAAAEREQPTRAARCGAAGSPADELTKTERRRRTKPLPRPRQGGPSPYGYRKNKDGILVPDEDEADIVRWIFRRYLQRRVSLLGLTAELAELGVTTRRGGAWTRASLSWMLRNDTYLGRVKLGRKRRAQQHNQPPTAIAHEAIIAPVVFNKTQIKLRAQAKRKRAEVRS